jgi:hypothetical protein
MSEPKFTKADRAFLAAVGIDAGSTFDADRLALAQRIAKHSAPTQVPIPPDAARRALVRLALERLLKAEPTK